MIANFCTQIPIVLFMKFNVMIFTVHKFDTSDFASNNEWKIPLVHKKVSGLMKDELNGRIMTHFVGLRSKMYTYNVKGGKCVKKSKEIKSNVVKNQITFQDYVDCLQKHVVKEITQKTIRSFAHKIYSIEQHKIGLTNFDDKRVLINNCTDTLPHGHYRLILNS
jgi:hypothetical protein